MEPLRWQKSSYGNEGANCVDIAAAPDGTTRLRESDEPDVILAVPRPAFRALLVSLKGGDPVRGAGAGR